MGRMAWTRDQSGLLLIQEPLGFFRRELIVAVEDIFHLKQCGEDMELSGTNETIWRRKRYRLSREFCTRTPSLLAEVPEEEEVLSNNVTAGIRGSIENIFSSSKDSP